MLSTYGPRGARLKPSKAAGPALAVLVLCVCSVAYGLARWSGSAPRGAPSARLQAGGLPAALAGQAAARSARGDARTLPSGLACSKFMTCSSARVNAAVHATQPGAVREKLWRGGLNYSGAPRHRHSDSVMRRHGRRATRTNLF